MRKILFRGKGTDADDKNKWYYGSYMKLDDTTYCFTEDYRRNPDNTKHYIVFDIMTDWGLPNRHMQATVRPETVCQYTGLKDKNGKKIFEGDIVEYEDESPSNYEYHDNLIMNRGAICYSDGTFYWTNAVATTLEDNVYDGVLDCKVIGNVFDNPELLEVQE